MHEDVRDWIFLIAKTIVFVLGGVMVLAALVELTVAGWSLLAAGVLAIGLLFAVPPLAFAFRDAYREARKGRLGGSEP